MDVAALRKTVLVVEDDLGICEMLLDVLRDQGYSVVSARSGEHALALLASVNPDLISLDYYLPGIQGSELIDAIRERRPADTCPIVLATAAIHVPPKVTEAVQRVIKKPFNIAVLLETVADLLTAQPGGRTE